MLAYEALQGTMSVAASARAMTERFVYREDAEQHLLEARRNQRPPYQNQSRLENENQLVCHLGYQLP